MKNMKPPGGAVMAAHLLWSFVVAIAAIWLYGPFRKPNGLDYRSPLVLI